MTGGKVILTYKRQRPPHWIAYKRKKQPSRKDFSEDSGCRDTSAEPPNYNGSATTEKQEVSTEENKSECPSKNDPTPAEKQEDSTEGDQSECPSSNAPTIAEKEEESTEGNRSGCHAKDYEHVPEGKKQSSGYIKQKKCLVSAEKAGRAEDENLFVHDIRQLAANSHAVLEASPRAVISQKASVDELSADLHTLGKSNGIQEASYSYVDSISETEAHQVSLNFSIAKDYTSDYTTASESDKFSLKETDIPVRDKSSSLCTTATLHSKLSSPLITFYRRCKRKKDVDGLHIQNTLGVTEDCALAFKGFKSAGFASVQKSTPPESGSEHILVDTNPSEKNLSRTDHEKMASTDIEDSHASRYSPETGNSVKQADDKLENTSQDNQSTVKVIPQNSVDVNFQEGPISCSGNLTNDSADDPSHEPVLSNGLTTVGKESQRLSNENLSAVRITGEIPSCRSSVVSLDLSVPLPDSHDVEDCGSLNSLSVSRTTIFNNESPGNKGSELLHEKVGERHSLHQAQVLENGCLSEEAVDHKHDSFASTSPVFKLENNCLQLFPEDRTDDKFQSTKIRQNLTACADSEDRTISLFESRSQAQHAATNSSLFLGLFLPMELINNGHDRTWTSSQWPNVGTRSKEFSQDTVPRCFPDQAASYQRHKMALDDIASRARMPKQKRGSCLNLYDSPRMWSEEELDCLWVGIRRYGRGNWEVMLRDPRLHFSPWRTPRDLAEQWEEEQSKLFNTLPSSRRKHLRTPNILRDSMDCFWHPKTRRENLVDNVQLSLGNVYSQPNDFDQKRSLFNFFDAQNNAPRQLQKAVTNARTMYSCRGNRRRGMLQHNAMLDVECSLSANQSTCMAVGGNLPHWLREVVSIPLRPPQTVLPSDTSSVGHVEMQWVKKPFPDARGVHHEPINQISNKHTSVERGEQQTGAGARNGNFLSALEHNKTEQGKYPGNKQDLIIIDSDASSEETISDDRTAKV